MRTARDETITVNFLVYTRSASFDYQWIYGLNDKSVERALQSHIINWLDTNLLTGRPPVTAFFQFQDYHALVLAQQSEKRVDPQERPIFQWACFLWVPRGTLAYGHLEPLSRLLRRESDNAYANIPNDTVRFKPEPQPLTIGLAQLEKATANLAEECWDLPNRIDWEDVIQQKLTVEVPASWGFSKMTATLIDQAIPQHNVVHIGNSIYVGDRLPVDQCWLISAKDPAGTDQETQPQILDRKGRPLSSSEIKKLHELSAIHRRLPKVKSNSRAAGSAKSEASPDYKEMANSGLPQSDDDRRRGDRESSEEEIELNNIDQLFKEFAKTGVNQKPGKLELVRLLKFWETKRSALIDVESRILLLLTPVTQSNSAYINVAWNNLLSEILLFNQYASRGMVEEWKRRAGSLETLTMKSLSPPSNGTSPQADWEKQFSAACNSLRTILESL